MERVGHAPEGARDETCFGAQSRSLRSRCVRFTSTVTRHGATLAAGWWGHTLPGRDSHPLDFCAEFRVGSATFSTPLSQGFSWRTHCLVLDGVYVRGADGQLCFHTLPRPTPEEVIDIARWTHEGIARVLARQGRSLDEFDDTFDVFADEQPALASCYGASLSDRQLLGASPGAQTRKLVHPVRELRSPDEALAEVGGVNVHVGSAIDANDRQRLERVCRYMTRPPVCQERLELSSTGQVVVRFKRAWRSGAHAVVLAPLDFIGRLVALIPAPRFNLTRYHGVFAARSKSRSEVVPGPVPKEPEPVQLRLAFGGEQARATLADEVETKPASRHPARAEDSSSLTGGRTSCSGCSLLRC